MLKKFHFSEEIKRLKEKSLYREVVTVDKTVDNQLDIDSKSYLNFSSNSYLGLHDRPEIKTASIKALQEWGCSSTSSRLVSGNFALHEILENEMASWKKTERALLFNSGFQANSTIIPAIADSNTLILSDKLNHASIIDGALLSSGTLMRYNHLSSEDLEKKILKFQEKFKRILVVTETIFSMDGDCAPLKEIAEICRKYECLLMVDDAHGSGICGTDGAGPAQVIAQDIDIYLSTFSKALGSFGACVACSEEIYNYLTNKSRGYIYTTGLPPAVVAANLAAIRFVRSEAGAKLRNKLSKNITFVRRELDANNYALIPGSSPIIPLLIGSENEALKAAQELRDLGIYAVAIRPPTVPSGQCRIRFTLSASHTKSELQFLIRCIKKTIPKNRNMQ